MLMMIFTASPKINTQYYVIISQKSRMGNVESIIYTDYHTHLKSSLSTNNFIWIFYIFPGF